MRERRARETGAALAKGDITGEQAIERLAKSERAKGSWSDALDSAIVTSSELAGLELQPRKLLLGDWFGEGDLGFIIAARGVGKTWFALFISKALSEGGKVGEWCAPAPTKVLYIDGEMPPDLMRLRDSGLKRTTGDVEFLNHEILFDRTQKVLNITEPGVQQAITDHCLRNEVKVLILDNLSTLASGMKENDSFEWERVNNWLLQFRRHKIAVIVVHHAGRNGEARGTSKREDAAFWVIALDDAKKQSDDKRGARFISRFTKPSRNTQEEVPAFEWHVTTDTLSGKITVSHKLAQSMDVFRKWIEDGVTECSQLSEELKVSRGTISKWASKAIREGWLKKKGRDYALVETSDDGNEEL
ncbi:MAG: AAA family ATPase [Chthoniobacterales bacterium]